MISLIIRDILKNTKYKYILSIIFIYLIYLIFQKIMFSSFFNNIFNLYSRTIGISYETIHFLDILIIVLTNFLFAYNALSILFSDLKLGKEQILLRISKRKYILNKMISIILITFILNLIIYILLSLTLFFMNYNIYNLEFLKLFFTDLILKIIFQYVIITLYPLFKNNMFYLYSFITPVIALLNIDNGKILFAYNNEKFYILVLILIIIFFIYYLILKYKIKCLFERSEKNEI